MFQDSGDRKRFMYDALKMAKKALDNEGEESCWEAHKWYVLIIAVRIESNPFYVLIIFTLLK